MKIESIDRLENKPGRFAVHFEGGGHIPVSAAQIADFGLYSGRELSDSEYIEMIEGLKLGSSKARALRILGSRSLSAREVEKRLVSKGESEEIARKTVEWLEAVGAVDDEDYAIAIARHYCAKGYGPIRIKDELYRRGIPRDLWDEALGGLDNVGEAAYDFLEKKLGDSRERADVRRATDALCRRGFGYEEARTIVGKYIENGDENRELSQ